MSDSQHRQFDSKSESYEQGRPSYPEPALRFLCEKMALDGAMTVADIGAGTGLLTRALQGIFANVIAVEPNDEMRSRLGPRAVKGTAEQTTLPSNSVHAIFAAQAFHWFHVEHTRAEFMRLLKGPRGVALLWNERDKSGTAGLGELEKIMCTLRGSTPQSLEADETAIQIFFQTPELNSAEFENSVKLSRDSLHAMVLSRSYAPKSHTLEHEVLTRTLDALFDSHSENGHFRLPYKTRVYWGHL